MKSQPFFLVVLSIAIAGPATAQSGNYYPVVETEISSDIVVGVEQSGTITNVAITTVKTSRSSSGTNTTTNTDLAVRNIEETRTRATNPAKRASRPKASGLLGGVVGALGGDYSGLANWGAGFIDHMMEPRYLTNVSRTFLTKDNHETETVTSFSSSWSNQNDFESTVTQNFSTDINKGFISFSVAVRNIGPRSVTIAEPTFHVFFENEAGASILVGSDKAPPGAAFNIQAGATQIFPIKVEGLDFIKLTQQYRATDSVRVHIQDMKIRQADGTLRPIGAVWDEISDQRVRFDYYDGSNRAIQFITVPSAGLPLNEFLDLALASTTRVLNPLGPNESGASLVRRVGARKSDMRAFSEVPLLERPNWRRWLVTAHDTLGTPLDPQAHDRIYPGFSVQLGYYAADQILPSNKYQPVIWQSDRFTLGYNRRIHIPVDLQAGDLIEVTDFKIEGYKIPTVTYQIATVPSQHCATADYGPMFAIGASTHLKTTPFAPTMSSGAFDKCVRLTPTGVQLRDAALSDMVFDRDGKPLPMPEQLGRMIWSVTGLRQLGPKFRHFADLLMENPDASTGSVFVSTNDIDQLLNTLELQYFGPGETIEQALERLLRTDNVFLYAVEGPVRKEESFWLFHRPDLTLRSGYALTNAANVPSTITAELLDDPMGYLHVPICETTGGSFGYGAARPACARPVNMGDRTPLYGFRYKTTAGYLQGDLQWRAAVSGSAATNLRYSTGPQLSARVRVLRYSEQMGTR